MILFQLKQIVQVFDNVNMEEHHFHLRHTIEDIENQLIVRKHEFQTILKAYIEHLEADTSLALSLRNDALVLIEWRLLRSGVEFDQPLIPQCQILHEIRYALMEREASNQRLMKLMKTFSNSE